MTADRCCPVCAVSDYIVFARGRHQGKHWEVLQCRRCRHGWTLPLVSDEGIASLYADDYLGDAAGYLNDLAEGRLEGSRSLRRVRKRVELVEKLSSGGHILDVGCGGGGFLATLDPDRWQRTGIEPLTETLDQLRPLLPEVDLVTGTLLTSELPAGSFDVITFWHSLEHIAQPLPVLEQAVRLLKGGGWILVNLPHFDSWAARLFGRYWYSLDAPRHRHHFSAESLSRLLLKVGLQPERLEPRVEVLHSLKQSLLAWSSARFSSRVPYYLLKPALFPFRWVELRTAYAGDLAIAGRLPVGSRPAEQRR